MVRVEAKLELPGKLSQFIFPIFLIDEELLHQCRRNGLEVASVVDIRLLIAHHPKVGEGTF